MKLLVKISGNGKFKGAFSKNRKSPRKQNQILFFILENSLADVSAVGQPSTREGFTEFQLKVDLKVDYACFQMESLLLSGFGNKIINDNYKIFLDELVPGLEDSLSRIFTVIVNSVLYDSTFEEMFPE